MNRETLRSGTAANQAGAPRVPNTPIQVPPGAPSIEVLVSDVNPTQMNWRPLTAPRRITFLGTSFQAVHQALAAVFGEFPVRLKTEHRAIIRAMAAVAGEGREPYDQISEALLKHGDVEIGVE